MSLQMSCRFSRPGFVLEAEVSMAPREMVVMSGPNGAGKTTFLHLVAGLLAVDDGEIRIADRVVDRAGPGSDEAFVQPEDRMVGLLPQGGALFPHLSASENVAFGVRARGASRTAARARAAELLEQYGVGELADRRPHEMSGGQRQRVAIARTMAVTPGVLLLDEPTTALDAASREDVTALLVDMRSTFEGPVVIVSHDHLSLLGSDVRRVALEPAGGTEKSVSVHLQFTHGLGGR